jgi:hypothetical protein
MLLRQQQQQHSLVALSAADAISQSTAYHTWNRAMVMTSVEHHWFLAVHDRPYQGSSHWIVLSAIGTVMVQY